MAHLNNGEFSWFPFNSYATWLDECNITITAHAFKMVKCHNEEYVLLSPIWSKDNEISF